MNLTISNRIKVAFVIPSLRSGGTERVMSYIASNINKSKFEVTLIVLGFEKNTKYIIEGINVIYLNKGSAKKSFFKLVKVLKMISPSIVFSSLSHVNSMMALISLIVSKPRYIGRESSVKTIRESFEASKSMFSNRLHNWALRRLDAVICQSHDMLNDFQRNNKNLKLDKFVIINNPITKNFKFQEREQTKSACKYITVSSLTKLKGHIRILDALSKLDYDFKYTIIGKGDEYKAIKSHAEKLMIIDNLEFIQHTYNVSEFLNKSDLYLQGSYVEGFPNAVLESCAVGTPVAAFSAPGGHNEIIIEGVNGTVINTSEEFTKKLKTYHENYPFNHKEVSDSVFSRFSEEIILKRYESLFTKLIRN